MFNFDIMSLLIGIPITLIALTGHELAHAAVSYKLGDPTPKYEGRLTLNPLAHLDLIGTLMMIFFHFGWAKPVGINPMYYKNRKQGTALVALAGPMANFVMALAAMIILGAVVVFAPLQSNITSFVVYVLQLFAIRNIGLMVFNLIPFPPLDGSKVLGIVIPDKYYYKMLSIERYSMIILMVLCVTGVFDRVLGIGISVVYNGIIRIISAIFGIFV